MNLVVLQGRITKEPELNQTNNGISYCQFSLAVNKPKIKGKEQEAIFVNCVAWQKQAEVIVRYIKKGNKMLIRGRLDITKNGDKYYTNVIVEQLDFIDTINTKQAENSANEFEIVDNDNSNDGFPF